MLIVSSSISYASNISKFVLDNYLLPVNTSGARISKIVPTPVKVGLASDTSGLFKIHNNMIYLKKNKKIDSNSNAFRYGITLIVDGNKVQFELLKDQFSNNSIIAHRGVWRRPKVLQNSLRSFLNAVAMGCEGSEMDVWLTADKKVILSHDPHIYGFEIEQTSSLELFEKTIDKPDPIPSLQELLLAARQQNTTFPVIEIKDSQLGLDRTLELTDTVVNIVHRMKMQGYVKYISFNYEVLKRIHYLDPTATTLYLWEGKRLLSDLVNDGISGIDYSYYAYRQDKDLNQKAHQKNLLTNVWTVNNAQELSQYYEDGVDYITTDEPELLLKIIQSHYMQE